MSPQDSPSALAEIIAAGVALIALAFKSIISGLVEIRARKKVATTKKGYHGIGKLMDALEDGRRASGAARGLFLISQNSGGIPMPGVPVKVSVRYESCDDSTRRIHEDFQEWYADGPYCKLLRTVATSGGEAISLATETLDRGVLRDLYKTDGHIGSMVFLLGHVPDGNWMAYASFNFKEEGAVVENGELVLTNAQRESLRSSVTRMRNILREYHEVLV